MFEVYRRHTPMFVTSEIRSLTSVGAEVLGLESALFEEEGIELLPIYQTVRINEDNEFIVKSGRPFAEVQQTVKDDPDLKKLRATPTEDLLKDLILAMAEKLQIDSYLIVGTTDLEASLLSVLPKATSNSRKPLVIFGFPQDGCPRLENPTWIDLDHPAVWLTGVAIEMMLDKEAFFAITPALKMEIELNRFKTLDRLAQFSFGMVRF